MSARLGWLGMLVPVTLVVPVVVVITVMDNSDKVAPIVVLVWCESIRAGCTGSGASVREESVPALSAISAASTEVTARALSATVRVAMRHPAVAARSTRRSVMRNGALGAVVAAGLVTVGSAAIWASAAVRRASGRYGTSGAGGAVAGVAVGLVGSGRAELAGGVVFVSGLALGARSAGRSAFRSDAASWAGLAFVASVTVGVRSGGACNAHTIDVLGSGSTSAAGDGASDGVLSFGAWLAATLAGVGLHHVGTAGEASSAVTESTRGAWIAPSAAGTSRAVPIRASTATGRTSIGRKSTRSAGSALSISSSRRKRSSTARLASRRVSMILIITL